MFPKNAKILVADDMRSMRLIVRNALSDLGYGNVVEAGDGAEALKIVESSIKKRDPVKLILCDWNMPDLNGLDLLKTIKAAPHTESMPFIMLTAKSHVTDVRKAIDRGIDGYLAKPFSSSELENEIGKAFAQSL